MMNDETTSEPTDATERSAPAQPSSGRAKMAAVLVRAKELLRLHWPRVKHSPYFVPAVMLAICMGVFFIARVFLLLIHHDDFASLTAGETLFAFVRGALFDGSISVTYIGLVLLVMMLPFKWAASKWCRRICGWYVFAALVVATFILGGDVVYFGYVHRHAGPETWAAGNDLIILFSVAYGQALVPVILVTISLAALGYGWHRLIPPRGEPLGRRWPHGIACFVVFAVFGLVARGGVTHKPLNIVNAFEGVTVPAGYLVLNGPFSLNHSLRSSYIPDARRLPEAEATAEVRRLVASERDTFLDADYPFLRERTVPAPLSRDSMPVKGPNVVILLMESWDSLCMDCVRRSAGLEAYGATPNFDEFASRGLLFTRFYATGQRSVHGIAAVLAGIPTVPGMPYIGLGLEQNRLPYLGRIAKRYGYSTYFLQGSPRDSYRCEAISSMAGFDNYYGQQDVPETGHAVRKNFMGAWDYDLLMKAHEVFASAPKPFMGLVFTLSTHGPFDMPGERWKVRPHDTRLNRYLHMLAYSDWALGELLAKAKEAGYFEDTVWVLVADHVGGDSVVPGDYLSYHHIALAIVAPGLEPGVRDTIGSQTDLFPTIMDLAGWSGRHATVGRSLVGPSLNEPAPAGGRFALCLNGEMVLWIDGNGWLLHDLSARRASHTEAGVEDAQAALDCSERRLLSTVQVLGDALGKNRVFRPDER